MARCRNDVSSVALALALVGCGTVDPGPNPQVAEVVFDLNFFYCRVEPMLITYRCAGGDSAKGDSQACHASVTSFRFQDPQASDPAALVTPDQRCNGIVPRAGIPNLSQENWGAASIKMRVDPDQAPLLMRPTAQWAHPREIFPAKSSQADLIRQWATRYSSR